MDKPRLSSLDLKEFRGIKKLESPPIDLAKFNVLIGRNNSGKTSLLEALALLPQPNVAMPFLNQARSAIITLPHKSQPDSLVYGYSGSATLSFTVGPYSSNLVLESNAHFHFETPTREDVPPNLGNIPVVNGMYTAPQFTSAPKSLSQVRAAYYNDDFHELLQNSLLDPANWSAIVKSRAHNRVLKDVVNPSISEKFTEVLAGQVTLQARKEFPDGTSTYIRLNELGSGLQRVIIPLLLFEATNPSIVLWDDIENGMHPTLLEHVMKWLVNRDWQVVISTHSIDVLTCLADLSPKDAQVIILRKSADDVLSHEVLNMEQYETVIDSNQDPRQITNLMALR